VRKGNRISTAGGDAKVGALVGKIPSIMKKRKTGKGIQKKAYELESK